MNWIETIALLKEAGYTQAQIAGFCKCGQSTISELGTGKIGDTSDSIGQALRALAARARRKLSQQAKSA